MKKKITCLIVLIVCVVGTVFYWNRFFDYLAVSTPNGYSQEPIEKSIKRMERSDFFASLVFDKRRRDALYMTNAIIKYMAYIDAGKTDEAYMEYIKAIYFLSREDIAICKYNKGSLKEYVEALKRVNEKGLLTLAQGFKEVDARYLFSISPEGRARQAKEDKEIEAMLKKLKDGKDL